jgi:hypothetical protein
VEELMASSRGMVRAGGGLGTGLILLVGGLIVKHSQANMVAECSSGLGQLGQAFDPNAASGCNGAQTLSSLATAAIWIGAVMLAIAVIGGIAMLAAAGVFVAAKQPKGAAAAAASAPGVRPAAGTTTVRPGAADVAPQSPGRQPGGDDPDPAAGIPGQGCGHPLRPGARFCAVCGRPAAGASPWPGES